MIQKRLGTAPANDMMRIYPHENGSHTSGGGEPGIFQQSIQDLIAGAEQGSAPPPSTRYTVRNGQVILPDNAAERGGLQPVMSLTAYGNARTTVEVNQSVKLAAKLEMPPGDRQDRLIPLDRCRHRRVADDRRQAAATRRRYPHHHLRQARHLPHPADRARAARRTTKSDP